MDIIRVFWCRLSADSSGGRNSFVVCLCPWYRSTLAPVTCCRLAQGFSRWVSYNREHWGPVVGFVSNCVVVCGITGQIRALEECRCDRPLMFSSVPRCHGLRGSQK